MPRIPSQHRGSAAHQAGELSSASERSTSASVTRMNDTRYVVTGAAARCGRHPAGWASAEEWCPRGEAFRTLERRVMMSRVMQLCMTPSSSKQR